jgi:hypothetical protein
MRALIPPRTLVWILGLALACGGSSEVTMEPSSVRAALEKDLPAILQLTAENRALLARLEPGYWRPSANADEFHSKYIQYLVTNPD